MASWASPARVPASAIDSPRTSVIQFLMMVDLLRTWGPARPGILAGSGDPRGFEAPCRTCSPPGGPPARSCSPALCGSMGVPILRGVGGLEATGRPPIRPIRRHLGVRRAQSGGQGRGLWPCRQGSSASSAPDSDAQGAQKREGRPALQPGRPSPNVVTRRSIGTNRRQVERCPPPSLRSPNLTRGSFLFR